MSEEEKLSYTLTVNGEERRVDNAWYFETLLEVLRNRLGLIGTKFACGTGQCGACTVHIDGRPVNACLELAALDQGHQITTIEGYSPADGSLTPLQEAIVTCADLQCGYCVPGMVMSAAALIEEQPGASAEDVREGLSGNLCRCTAYGGYVEAVRQSAEGKTP
ncbi:MAG: (2Fe-2S)-binding protein [Mycobacterium sp.]|nr:(2Fe-2S)-binding protein [Mycobacterium sp.]